MLTIHFLNLARRMRLTMAPVVLALIGMAASAGHLSAGALYLDGNGSYVTFVGTSVPSGGANFTVEAWINPTSIPTGGEDGGQITFWGNQSANQANGFRLRGATGTRHYFWGNDHDANLGINILPDTTGPSGDGWHHLALTYNGSQTVWYWNGTAIGTRQAAAGVNVSAVNHRIGSRLNAEFFHGFIDEIRIWSTARSAAEIQATMNQSLNGTEANLVTYFDFEGNLGDRAGGDNNGTALGNAVIDSAATAPIQTTGPWIFSFTASTNLVMIGTPATLSWRVTNAPTLFIDSGVGPVTGATGSVPVTPLVTTTYTLTASNEFGVRTALVTISVNPGIPLAIPQSVATIKNTPVNVTLTGSDPNGNTLTYSVVTLPQHGNLSGAPPNVVYAPANDYSGNDFFTFKVNDGTNDSPAATVTIRVEATPTPPSAIVLSTTNINANAGPGQFLATLRAIDANPLDTHVFALVVGAGGTHNGLFAVAGTVLVAGPGYGGLPGTNYFIRLRVTDTTGLTWEQAVVLRTVVIEQNVVINEVNYNGPNNTVRDEFIELYNPRPNAVDLSQWRLRGGVDFFFPQGTVIPSGGFLVVAQNPGVLFTNFGVSALGPWDGQLNNEGEDLSLRDPADHVMDEVAFRSEFPWPIAANGEGGSMELINPSLDNDLGSSWATPLHPPRPSPGRTNQVFALNAAPNIRQVNHTPERPASSNTVVITAKVTDPEGVATVTLSYQVVLPGSFIPATLPLTTAQLNSLNTNPGLTNALNPAFEAATNWISVAMNDDGVDGDAVADDNIYGATLPPQANRNLVRYRITVADTFGASRRAPFEDDPSLNFAYFVYDGIPTYQGYSPDVLETLPVYWLVTRDADITQCTAWSNSGDQLPQDVGGTRNSGRLHFNWEGAMVYDGVVYDHVKYRLRGANGRYHSGKRSFRIRFNDGHHLGAKDQFGNDFPKKWQELTTGKGQSNRGSESFALNEVVNYFLWNKVGVPAPSTFHFHFRVVRGVDETNRYQGDFWGLNWAQEEYDVGFLEAHDLPKGNLYKLVDNYVLGVGEQRYQGPFAVTNAADFYNIENNLTGLQSTNWLLAHANFSNWFHYHTVAEAIRHYDVWPSCNKNGAWYFEPTYSLANSNLGRMWLLPYDGTDTWGPTWNGGQDVLHNGIFNDAGVGGGDSGENAEMQREYRNVVRQVRDLLFQPDQIGAVIDAFAARIRDFAPADIARWLDAPAPASYRSIGISSCPGVTGGLAGYVQDMKNFMFVGGNNAWWIDRQSVSAGGWITRLDQLAADAAIPATPKVNYAGLNGFPINALTFTSSPFSDPQGNNTVAAMQWRLAEVQDLNEPMADPRIIPALEWDAAWDSGPLTNLNAQVTIPPAFVKPLKLYRVRVRHLDNTGRWSRWSVPFSFYPAPADVLTDLQRGVVFSEIMYHPPSLGAIDGDELEFIEVKNIGATILDLTGLFFSEGINFTFTNGTTLAPGALFLLGRNPTALDVKYPGIVVNGVYTGKLDNAGETVTLRHPQGVDIVSVSYNDRPPWPATADGYGFSLVLGDLGAGTYYPSTNVGGSPGFDDFPPTTPAVVINEVLANSEPPEVDRIELFNSSANPANIGGWYLSDDATQPFKYRIADGTTIPAGGFLAFNETQFNPAPDSPTSFAISSGGDDVYLFAASAGGTLLGYVSGIDFGASETNVSLGRHMTSDGRERIVRQAGNTFGGINAGPRVGPLVISEIMYRPPDVNGSDDSTNEFIEVVNISAATVPLFDPAAPTNTWNLKGGVDFVFPTNQTLGPGAYLLLVNFDPSDTVTATAFRARYGGGFGVPLFGPYSGKLNNAGDDVELQMPILLSPTNSGYVLMDKVDYRDDAPWPKAADGLGLSLHRVNLGSYGDDPSNWLAAPPTPAAPRTTTGISPVITTQPANQVASQGQSVLFSVGATGSGPLQYRWLFNGAGVPGAIGPSLQLTGVQPKDIGSYQAVVFNDAGSTISMPAALSVRMPAFIMQQPQSVVLVGSTNVADYGDTTNGVATFTVQAHSSNPLSYQWRFNGTPVPGATGPSLTISNVNLSHQGVYEVVLSDLAGSITSDPARLDLMLFPVIVVAPQNQVVPLGGYFSASVTIRGGPPPFLYQWRRGSQILVERISSNTNDVLTWGPVTSIDQATWRIALTNAASPVITRVTATFTVTVQADFDNDGLPDPWEVANGFSTNNPGNASVDLDGDGMTLLQEYLAGTDWNDPSSYLRIDRISVPGTTAIEFLAAANRTFSVEYKDELGATSWSKLIDVPAGIAPRTVLINDPAGSPKRFYRLVTPGQP